MLVRQHDRGHLNRHTILIAQRELRLGVRAQGRFLAGFPHLGQTAQDGVGILDRRGHQFWRLAAGIAEHDALIAGTITVDALGDMGRLAVQVILHFQRVPVKFILLIADVLDAGADDVLHPVLHRLQRLFVRQPNLAADHNAAGGGKGFAGDAGMGFFGQEGIKNRVRHPVAKLIWMALGHRFRGEDVILSAHGSAPL